MDIWSWLQEVALLLVVYEITSSEGDLLESFRPSADNPPELNDFLANVLEHKHDFSFVRQAARKYQKMKKDTQDLYSPLTNSMNTLDFQDFDNKINDKRHVLHGNTKRKFRNLGLLPPNMRNKFNRMERKTKKRSTERDVEKDIQKRFPAIIMLQQEDDTVHKRMPVPAVMQAAETKVKKHLPSQIYIEPQGEALHKRTPEIIAESESESGKIISDDEVLKRTPEGIVVEVEGENGEVAVDEENDGHKEKKQILDLDSDAVHRTYKSHQGRQHTDAKNRQGDYFYADLEEADERNKERSNGDRRRYGWDPRKPFYYPSPENRMYNRPFMGRAGPENMEYPEYDNSLHHNPNDDVAFEKALSYEIEPRYPENYNNPSGNSLYSVDEGRPDNIQPFYPQNGYSSNLENPPDIPAVSNERFYIDADSNMKRIETSSTESSSTNAATAKIGFGENKNLKHVGSGFIEITKSRRDNEEGQTSNENSPLSRNFLTSNAGCREDKKDENLAKDTDEKNKKHSGILSKLSLHPLNVKDTSHDDYEESLAQNEEDERLLFLEKRETKQNENREEVFQSRKLQFIDYEVSNSYNEDENYEEVPVRARRDFLDALGMKNEEDYSEDNPYKDEMNVNNTDVHNDTHIEVSCTPTTTTHKTTSLRSQKEDFKNIKQILEGQKNLTGVITVGSKKKVQTKRGHKRFSQMENFDDVPYEEIRQYRDADNEMETKILQNKNRIANTHQTNPNVNHVQVRQEPSIPKWTDMGLKLNEPNKFMPMDSLSGKRSNTDASSVIEATTVPPQNETGKENNTESVNTTYEQMAHQMDVENEKLAQVVNGHLASKIVSEVFGELKKKSGLKAKFYSGLSRKHVNYAGTIDFDIFKANETEDVDEARLLLGQITKVLNRLVLNQVRRKLCQRLPDELKDYLDILLNVKNTLQLEPAGFIPNTQQGDFLFTYQENKDSGAPFDLKRLENTLETLENLLLTYHSMSQDCQSRAEPIKDYIEKHVKVAKQMVNCPSHNCADKFSETKRDTPMNANDLFQKQLESVGLGRNQEFIPNFDINQMVKNKMRTVWKNDKKRDVQKRNDYKSQQYRKLQLAAERVREKRENEKKIAEVFGKQKRSLKKPDVDYEEPVVYSIG